MTHAGILIAVIGYLFVLIGGVGGYLSYKARKAETTGHGAFLLSNRDMNVAVLGTTLAFSVLGAAHVLGGFEMTWYQGAITVWFSLAHVVVLTVACLATGRWVRRLGVTTIPELLGMMHGKTLRVVVSCVMAGVLFGFLTLECQGIGILFATMTGWTIQKGAVVGGCFGILYVILAGMKEIGWVNLINAFVKYIGLIAATIYIGLHLPSGGWGKVADFYVTQDQGWMLSIFGTSNLFIAFALSNVIAVTFCQGINQMLMQPCMAAKSEDTVRKAIWIAAPVNGLFGVFIVVLGLAAKTMPDIAAVGPKLYGPYLLVQMLPTWLVALVLASFVGAVLSTFAMAAMTAASIFSADIYRMHYNPNASGKQVANVTKAVIVVLAIIAMAVAASLPPIIAAVNWLFSFIIPVFWLVIFGLFWKRSEKAALTTCFSSWIVNLLWSFTSLPELLNIPNITNVYVVLVVTIIVGVVSLAIMDGKPGYFKSTEYLQKKNELAV